MKNHSSSQDSQRGIMLLEALISILILSIGVLGIVALQAASVKNAGDAKYRSDASLLSNKLIAQMWVTDRTTATLQTKFASAGGGTAYTAWSNDVAAALPGALAVPPTVTVTPVTTTVTPSSLVTITIFWRAPNETPGTAPHKFVAIAQVV
jgi:type IV pilus assembly protein PilV